MFVIGVIRTLWQVGASERYVSVLHVAKWLIIEHGKSTLLLEVRSRLAQVAADPPKSNGLCEGSDAFVELLFDAGSDREGLN